MNSPVVAKTEDPSSSAAPSEKAKAEDRISNSPVGGAKDPPRDAASPANDEKGGDDDAEQEPTFPQQLMDAIEKETINGTNTDDTGKRVIEWTEDGESFIIRDKAKLERQVLPRHFHAKCKFMSFVRKLYRWGFRQIEKTLPGKLVFSHPNFVRGDKKRCLLMRSIVKKAEAQPQSARPLALAGMVMEPFSITGMAASEARFPPSMIQAFGASGQYGMGAGAMNSFAPPLFSQQARQVTYPPLDQGCMPGQYSQGGMGGGGMMTSKDMFEAGLRLERIERMEREQIQMQQQMQQPAMAMPSSYNQPSMMSGLNNDSAYGNMPPRSSFNSTGPMMPTAMSGNNNYGSSNTGVGGDNVSQLEIASKLMKRDPSLEPWRALEMAKHFNNSC